MKWCIINNDETLYYGDDDTVSKSSILKKAYFSDFKSWNIKDLSLSSEMYWALNSNKEALNERYREFFSGFKNDWDLHLVFGIYKNGLKDSVKKPWMVNKFLSYFYNKVVISSPIVLIYSVVDMGDIEDFKDMMKRFLNQVQLCYSNANNLKMERDTTEDYITAVHLYSGGDKVLVINGDDKVSQFMIDSLSSEKVPTYPIEEKIGKVNGEKIKVVSGNGPGAVYTVKDGIMSIYFGSSCNADSSYYIS